MFHSKENPLCPCVAAAQRGEGAGEVAAVSFLGVEKQRGRNGLDYRRTAKKRQVL